MKLWHYTEVNRLKILIVNKFLFPNGGSETYIFKIGEELKKLGHEVQYFGMEHAGRVVSNRLNLYTKDMDFHEGSLLSKLSYPVKTIYSGEAKKKMFAVLRDFQPDVVHLNNFNYQLTPSVIVAVKKYEKETGRKVKIIYTAHDYQLVCPDHMMMTPSGEICEKCATGEFINCFKNSCVHSSKLKSVIGCAEGYFWKYKNIYSNIDTVICPSSFIESKLMLNPVFKGKTTVIHNFTRQTERKPCEKGDYVLYFGRLSAEKGVETIMASSDINFVCAGSGPLEKEVSECAHIKYVGFKSGKELEELISKAVCSVYPSVWYENCPFSVMESISYGTPVVGANIGGIPELIDDGKTGFLFEPGNVKDFSEKVSLLLNDSALAKKMSDNCLDKEFMTVSQYCKKLLEIYA